MELLDIESVRCFVAAAERLNFAAAARVVAISPQAFSSRIQRLEDDVGVPLFARTTRKVSLTPAGMRVLPRARQLLADAQSLVTVAQDDTAVVPIQLRLGTRFELGMSYVVPALLHLERTIPGLTIDVVFGDSPDLMRSLDEGRVDCVITSLRLTMPQIAYATLHEERYALVAAPDLIAQRPLCSATDAPQHTLLDTLPSLPLFRYFLDAVPGEAAWSFRKTRHLGAIAAVRHLAIEGAGVAVLPEYFVRRDMENGALARLMADVELNRDYFRLIWKSEHMLTDVFGMLAAQLSKIPLQ